MSVTTPALGTPTVGPHQTWYRLVRRIATRPGSELSLVYVPEGPHDRLAVLKRLPPALATDPAAVEKFRIEARIAALFDHPNIVRVFEVVEAPHEDFYTMEYVRGADMRQLMDALATQRRTLPLDCVLLIALAICEALDHAHNLSGASGLPAAVIHRELSPSKVLLGLDGNVKLTGFGAPSLVRERPRRARTASVSYVSPERCLGEQVDARSDVFALGVLLYELSSGERLFADATTEHQIMMKIVRGDLPRPSEVRRGYPRELEQILMRALARDRNQRYQRAAELHADLETFLWSRWPTASTAALAKLVSTTFPSDEAADLALGTRELERISPTPDEPVLWLGPVPLAKPFPRVGEVATARADTRELRRMAPQKFPDASNVDVTLGASGAKPATLKADRTPTLERAATIDELAIPVVHADAPPEVDLELPELAPATHPPRGQYQRPEALDERPSDDAIIEHLRAKQRARPPAKLAEVDVDLDEDGVTVARARGEAEAAIARIELQRIATPVVRERVETVTEVAAELDLDQASLVSWTLLPSPPPPDPIEAVKQRLPSPPPVALVAQRRWPLGTLAAIVGVVVIGVMASAWAIRRTVHEPSDLPAVITAQPSPPTDVVLRTTQRANVPAVPVPAEAKKSRPRPAAKHEARSEHRPPANPGPLHPADAAAEARPSLFPPSDRPGPGSLDGLPAIRTLEVKGSIADLGVRKAVEQALSPLRGCYRAAARTRQQTPHVELTIAFDLDARRVPVKVRAVGGGALDTLATCATKVVSELRDLPAPSKGTARVSVLLAFRPNP